MSFPSPGIVLYVKAFAADNSLGLAAYILKSFGKWVRIGGACSVTELGNRCAVPKAVCLPYPAPLEAPDIVSGSLLRFGFFLYASLSYLATAAIKSGFSLLSTPNASHSIISILYTKAELLQLASLRAL